MGTIQNHHIGAEPDIILDDDPATGGHEALVPDTAIPIGYGVMAEDEVLQRIFYLTSVKPGSDF